MGKKGENIENKTKGKLTMKYVKFVLAVVAAALLTTTAFASTNVVATPSSDLGAWTISLSGAGNSSFNGSKIDASAFGAEVQLGHSAEIVLPAEVGLRQSLGYADSDVTGANWLLATKGYVDWTLIKLGNLEFDAGGNVGLTYGNTSPVWTIAPEVLGRVYLKKDVDVFARVEYPFNLTDGKAENRLTYALGVRVRF